MEKLATTYIEKLDEIKKQISSSELLSTYLDTEEETDYKAIVDTFEGGIHQLYCDVADHNPLQLESFEKQLLDPEFEGLYLPKLLGYCVLRGEINENYKYYRPQSHLGNVLTFISQSSNFEEVQKRVGQSIQMGFALSSDIRSTNIINSVKNKRAQNFYKSQMLEKFRDIRVRRTAFVKYKKQFQSLNFYTAKFPTTAQELQQEYNLLKAFLIYRSRNKFDNKSLLPSLAKLSGETSLLQHDLFLPLLILFGHLFEVDSKISKNISGALDTLRKEPGFSDVYFKELLKLWAELKYITADEQFRMSQLINDNSDKLTEYYNVVKTIASKGFVHDDSIDETRDFYYNNTGLSDQNKCIRYTISSYVATVLDHLDEESYNDYFDLQKTITQYIQIFDNQEFNQEIKGISMRYIKRLLKKHIDKRGKDYQEIKKFVKTTFLDLGFNTEKELKELFKTKKPRVSK